jgi:hypothetical protein
MAEKEGSVEVVVVETLKLSNILYICVFNTGSGSGENNP